MLEESVDCVVMCSHVLYPSPAIMLDRLAFLMSTPNRDWSLIALLSALSCQEYVSYRYAKRVALLLLQSCLGKSEFEYKI